MSISSRRAFLLTTGAAMLAGPEAKRIYGQGTEKVLVPHPSWDCGMKDGIPNRESGIVISKHRSRREYRPDAVWESPGGRRAGGHDLGAKAQRNGHARGFGF